MKTTTTTTRWAVHTTDAAGNTTRHTPDLHNTIAEAKAAHPEVQWGRSNRNGAKGALAGEPTGTTFEIVPETKALAWETTEQCKMAATLNNYRHNYEPHLTAAGKKSLSNGDAIAKALATATPAEVVALAEQLLQLPAGSLWTRYENLNAGQQRMNAGNRIRAAYKKGLIVVDDNGNLHTAQ